MSRIAFVNGRYLPMREARVPIEDRGYQFADGIYEVCEVRGGRLIDERPHMARLQRSLSELRINQPVSMAAIAIIVREVVRRNRILDGVAYLQITRGVAPRGHAFPENPVPPSLVVTARRIDRDAAERRAAKGLAVISVPENRWARVDIKSISLLPNVLAKQAAVEKSADEAWFVDADGMVSEGSSSNAWILSGDNVLITAPADHRILGGVTRANVLLIAAELGIIVEERRFSLSQALDAREAFITAATALVTPVVKIDGHLIGEGRPGPLAKALRRAYRERTGREYAAASLG